MVNETRQNSGMFRDSAANILKSEDACGEEAAALSPDISRSDGRIFEMYF